MPQTKRTKTLWIALIVTFLLFIVNQWMSREINKPVMKAQQDDNILDETMPEHHLTHTAKHLPPTAFEEGSITKEEPIVKPKPSVKQHEDDSEPIYEAPNNSVILVQ